MSSTGMNQERCLTSEKLAFEQKNDKYLCKYLNQNGDCLEMGYGNSRGPKLGRETIGKKRKKGNRLFYRV